FLPDAVGLSLENEVEPRQVVAAFRQLGSIRRIFQFCDAAMAERANDEPAAPAGAIATVALNRHKRIDGALQKDVIPAAVENCRSMNALSLRFGVEPGPELVVPGMSDKGLQVHIGHAGGLEPIFQETGAPCATLVSALRVAA